MQMTPHAYSGRCKKPPFHNCSFLTRNSCASRVTYYLCRDKKYKPAVSRKGNCDDGRTKEGEGRGGVRPVADRIGPGGCTICWMAD